MTPEPVVKKRSTLSAVWTLPFIALCICLWLLYSSYKTAGVEITIYFENATGIVPGKTQVMARGIPIGLVQKVLPDLENRRVKAIVKMEKQVEEQLVEDTLFWVVRPELSASSVRGLDTILTGSYINVQVGISTVSSRNFNGLVSAPPIAPETPGLHLQLRSEVLGSIQVGTGIYYRNIEIGKVQQHRLEEDESILIDVFIEPDFAHLVREGSRFSNASGVQISGKLSNLKIKIESLASLLRGGILLHTPEQLQDTPLAENNHIFVLYPDYESADYGIPMTLTLASGEDIVEGSTKVMYRGLEAGFVKEIQINQDERRTVTAHIQLDPRAELILREETKFWLVKPMVTPSGIHNLGQLLSGAHITFQPGEGEFKKHFDILPEPPPQTPLRPGKTFVLMSEDPIELSADSPVYFKNITVGKVVDIDLAPSARTIRTTFFINEEYLHLLSRKSVFWNHSGIEVGANINDGFSVSTGPLSKILQGGVSFTTPNKLKKQKNYQPEEGFEYQLHKSYMDAVATVGELQPAGKRFRIISKDAQSLSEGAPILHKKIKIGEIEGFSLTGDQQNVLIDCFVYEEYQNIVNEKTKFFNTSGFRLSGGLSGLSLQTGSLQSIIAGGIDSINVESSVPTAAKEPYTLYKNREDALKSDGVKLTIYLDATQGLKVGSPVRHKGIAVGRVDSLNFADDIQTIICIAYVNRNVAPLFRTRSLVWVEQAQINLSGVKNVETLVFGSYLHFLEGDGPPSRIFSALSAPPLTEIANRDGLGIILEAKHLGSLNSGSPIYYRQVQVGQVTGHELSPSFQKVYIFATIYEKYKSLIRNNTKFWNVSGTKIEGGIFSGLSVSIESVEAIMRGGIALATPDNERTSSAVNSGHHFTLYDKAEKAWLDWSPDIILLEKEQAKQLPFEDT
ncbi:MAG: MlaD family protein [Desulforhopalus sp.]